ncbi:MAG TPA: hypothetical protein VNX29_13295 [Kaistia sp.]|nr:hypothetical protein [Kaistia sp.]
MKATAEIIDLDTYRKAKRRAATSGEAEMVMPPMIVGWMPVWVLVPVPVGSVAGWA